MPLPPPPMIPTPVCASGINIPINITFSPSDVYNGNAKGYFYQEPYSTYPVTNPAGTIVLEGLYQCVHISFQIDKNNPLVFDKNPMDHVDDPPGNSQFGDVKPVGSDGHKIRFDYTNTPDRSIHHYKLHILDGGGNSYIVDDPVVHNTGPPPQSESPIFRIFTSIAALFLLLVAFRFTLWRGPNWFGGGSGSGRYKARSGDVTG